MARDFSKITAYETIDNLVNYAYEHGFDAYMIDGTLFDSYIIDCKKLDGKQMGVKGHVWRRYILLVEQYRNGWESDVLMVLTDEVETIRKYFTDEELIEVGFMEESFVTA